MSNKQNKPESTEQSTTEYNEWKKTAEQELWNALEALENDDLPTVRSTAARIKFDVQQAWLVRH